MFAGKLEEEIQEEIGLTMSQIKLRIREELVAQGHVLTGRLRDSIDTEVERRPNLYRAMILMEDYGFAIDQGVAAENIPFTTPSGRGGTSEYIKGLFAFWLLKGLSSDDALSAAFATAQKQKQEGMPTRSSFFYSSNQRRTGFFTDTIDAMEDEILSLGRGIENKGAVILQNLVTDKFKTFERIAIRA